MLKRDFPLLFKDSGTQTMLDEAIRFLMKTGGYEAVSFERKSNGEYVIVGRPLRVVEDIRFKGEESFSKSKLLDVLDFKVGEKFDRKKAVAAGERLKQFYGESGYFNTVINLSFPKAKNQNIILQFDITENAPCRIVKLDLRTDNPVLKLRLYERLKRYVGRPLTEDLVRSLSKRANDYFIDRRYLTAELIGPEIRYNEDKSASFISYEIKDPYRWEFFVDGNVYDSNLDIFSALNWSNRERKNVEPASEGAERIKRDYLKKGFPQVQVDFQVETDSQKFLKKVFYDINEGYRVRLKSIEIQGRVSRTPAYYRNFILNNSSELISRGYYNRQDLEEGFKNLTTELRNQGYLRARIQSSRLEYDATKKNATVFVLVDEGPLTIIQAIDFEGNHFISNFELTEVLGLTPSSRLHLTELEAGIERIKKFYRNQGFLEMKILNEGEDLVHYNESGTVARLLLKLYEGPRVRIAAVRVEGNTFTKSWVVLKEADFRTGQILTPSAIDNAVERLNRMGLFSRVDVRTLEENTSVSERTVIIAVTDRDPGLFRFGAGVNSERGLTARGFTSLSYNNLWGTARAISGRFQLSENVGKINYPETDVTVGYMEPFMFDSLTRGRVNLSRSEHVFDYSSDTGVTKLTLANKLTMNLERDFNRHWRGIWKLWKIEERKDFVRGMCPDASGCSDLQYVATMGPTLEIDYRDSAFTPTRGSLTRLIGDYSDPGFGSTKGINFIKTELHQSYYTPVAKDNKRWVWANHGRAGYLANIASTEESGVPVSQSFFLGGVDTVRGFDYAQDIERIPPGKGDTPDDHLPITRGTQIIIHSDSHYFLLKSELRFPIYGDHGGVLFYDGGAVYVSGYNFPRPYRDSIGIGYRYNTPVGPVNLDIAFKIGPRTDQYREAPFRVHFSIGSF